MIDRSFVYRIYIEIEETRPTQKSMSDTNNLMDFISARLGTTLDKVYQRLIDCNIGLEDLELAMFAIALLNAIGREGCGDRHAEKELGLGPVPPSGAEMQ